MRNISNQVSMLHSYSRSSVRLLYYAVTQLQFSHITSNQVAYRYHIIVASIVMMVAWVRC